MKRNKIYILLLSGLLMASCSKEEQPSPTPGGEDALVTVSVAVDGVAKTKAESETQPGDEKENAIKNLTVVFIDAAKNEVIGHTYKEMTGSESEKKVTVALKTGIYKMLVMANTKEVNSFIPKDYYDLIASLPEQGGENGFVMSNIAQDVEIKAIEGDKKNVNEISEKVKRVVGRVDLSKLDVNWENTDTNKDLQGIDGLEFRLTQVFLANVRPKSYLFDMTGWDFMNDAEKHALENKEDGYLCGIDKTGGDIVTGNIPDKNLLYECKDVTINSTTSKIDLAHFYAMTNSDTKESGSAPVILYIKGDLYDGAGNAVLTNRYYRIKLAKGVQRNTIYKIEATIEGKGSPEPGDNKDNVKMSVTISVETWEGVTLDTITIDEEIEI
ncbi:fimbrial protein [Parabacteroides gordonii]|uniref:Major fimbrial subunit protein N-terminal domain-containing protein n=1 Tax=Parabacteroides gordonii MS-1 = DSM 23371 TaxID=1203610 RepID=A0A0F5IWD3_9BACT|nr:fimbrial protein [Parabacteroides gordonii]KKB49530.1 hypothetical protein HMPREF1536_04595 [Parabacteroides gordonii MS-1 = DSM 23371]MCA5585793.1 hypothetical protein [Parabacteroides gordonii]